MDGHNADLSAAASNTKTVFSVKLINTDFVVEYPEPVSTDDTDRNQLNVYLQSFRAVLDTIKERRYDRDLVSQLMEAQTQLVIYEPRRRIQDLERQIKEMENAYIPLKHRLAAYEYAMGTDGAAELNNRLSTSNQAEGPSDLEERFGRQIDNLKEELVRNEQLLNEKQRGIIEKETSLVTLQTEYDKLEEELNSAKAQFDQDQTLISKLEEDKNGLKDKLRRNKEALEDDKTKLKQSLECILQNEALLRENLTNLMQKIEQLQRQLRQVDVEKGIELQNAATLQQQLSLLKHQHNTEVESLKQLVMEKEEECRMWKSKFKDLQQGIKNNKENRNRQADISVRTLSDEYDSLLSGMALIPNNRMVVCDGHNNTVKIVDLTSSCLVTTTRLSSRPWDVCAFSGETVAVTLPNKCRIQMIKTNPNIELTRTIQTTGSCRGISFWQNTFIVTIGYDDRRGVAILDIDGQVLKAIFNDLKGRPLFKRPHYVSVGGLKPTLYVSDRKLNTLTKLDLSLRVLQTLTLGAIEHPYAMFQHDDKHLLVCSAGRDNVVMLNTETEQVRDLLGPDATIHEPICACYSHELGKLYMTCWGQDEESGSCNAVIVFDVKLI